MVPGNDDTGADVADKPGDEDDRVDDGQQDGRDEILLSGSKAPHQQLLNIRVVSGGSWYGRV